MHGEVDVLSCLWPALVEQVGAADTEELVIVRTGPARRRSSVFFLGLAGSGPTCRWVLKRPNSGSRQVDLQSPLPAVGQFEALQRLHRHLQQRNSPVTTPRPVACVPEIDAYLMEYVPGPTLAALLTPAAVLRPKPLLRAVAGAAQVLHEVHSLEPPEADTVDLAGLSQWAASCGREVLAAAGLPAADRWFGPGASTGQAIASKVLLHGDFCPENVLLSPSGLVCLEPDLCVRDWAERDVVRFLLMMFDAPLFVAGVDVPLVQRLRRRAAAAFLGAFYGDEPWPETLRPLMMLSVAARWSTRHTDLNQRAAGLRRARETVLRRSFSTLLDEVSSPTWPLLLRRPATRPVAASTRERRRSAAQRDRGSRSTSDR